MRMVSLIAIQLRVIIIYAQVYSLNKARKMTKLRKSLGVLCFFLFSFSFFLKKKGYEKLTLSECFYKPEDQQRINSFSKLNNRIRIIQEKLGELKVI